MWTQRATPPGLVLRSCLLLLSVTGGNPLFAHPSPTDIAGISRHQLGITVSLISLFLTAVIYLALRLRPRARANTVREFFFFDKQVSASQYFDTTVSYSLQVVVTLYFVYWGFVYGIYILYYAVTWFFGIFLFCLAARRLLAFALSPNTLHSFLATRYGTSATVRRLTALCTLSGLTGGLIIEVNYGTDILAALAVKPISQLAWITLFLTLLYVAWLYIVNGGYKSAVLIYAIQLPVIYITLSIVLCYLVWLGFNAGYTAHALYIGIITVGLWCVVVWARTVHRDKSAPMDNATWAAVVAATISIVVTLVCVFLYGVNSALAEAVSDKPDSFTLSAFLAQHWLVVVGFTILNISWQFFDMTAWQRISSLELTGLSEPKQVRKLKGIIQETMYESPVTWAFGIIFGIALRHTGLFKNTSEAFDSFFTFVRYLSDNDLPRVAGMIGSYFVLPCIVIAFIGIMLSTTDSFLATIIFTWVYDIARVTSPEEVMAENVNDSAVLKTGKRASFWLLAVAAVCFVAVHRFLHVNVFLLLNTVYSAQFLICFFSIGALFLAKPSDFKNSILIASLVALLANVGVAFYCYVRMKGLPESVWSDWFYVLPTVASALVGGVAALLIYGSQVRARGK
jgi:hypothetical protein